MRDISTLEKDTNVSEHEAEGKRGRQKRKRSYRGPRGFFLGLVAIVAVALFGFIFMTANDLPSLAEIENPSTSLSTQLISTDGVVLDNFYSQENRVNVKLNEISPYVIDALIATEDARFYRHSGVDYMSIPALIKRNLTGTTSGGSTITMQLARNLFNNVSTDRTISRKIKEVIVSAILEKNFTKEEIITAYLNTVNIFGNAYGIEMAAQRLFAKPARDLTIEESAVMVGMLKGQGVFDPINNPDTVQDRRNLVINLMVRHGFLDDTQVNVDSIKELPVKAAPQVQEHLKGIAPYFRQKVREFMQDWCNKNTKPDGSNYDLYSDGLKIYTTIDSRMQRHAEAATREHLTELQQTFDKHIKGAEPYKYDPQILTDLMKSSDRYRLAKKKGKSMEEIRAEFDVESEMKLFGWDSSRTVTMTPWDSLKYYSRFLETGLVSINPLNGEVKAWVGGIDFKHFKYDHVAQGKRQAGSTFKPFVYLAAIDAGYTPCDKKLNQPIVFENTDGNGTRWSPKNANGKYGGMMTLRQGLARSTNLITARLMYDLGPSVVVDYARRLGIRSPLDAVPALCLGVADVSVLEMTGAYSAIANKGQWVQPHYITRIEDKNGEILAEFPVASRQVISPRKAYMMVELLKGVVDEPAGTASRLRHDYKFRVEIGAKTGTTQNHSDGWFMGMTQNLVSGVWVGCADRRMRFNNIKLGQGANMALPIWALYMDKLYEDASIGLPQERFSRPGGYGYDMVCDEPADSTMGGMPVFRMKKGDDLEGF